ncbi:MAG: glycosyltransferase family 2 protein [Candidatus Electrothrix sp.]
MTTSQAGICSADELIKVIVSELSREILRHCLTHWLLLPEKSSPLSLDELVEIPYPAQLPDELPLITVAVCTKDRTILLADCLKALQEIDYPKLDVLIVDNAPTDDSARVLVESFPEFRYVCEPVIGLDTARNRAIQEARGEIVAFTDDDAMPGREWVQAIAEAFAEDSSIMAVTGLVAPAELQTEPQWIFEKSDGFGRGFAKRWISARYKRHVALSHGGSGKFGTGANMAFRRCLFEEIGYFDPKLDVGTPATGGGDLDMFFRVIKTGYTLVYEPRAIVFHRHRRKYKQLALQYESWGIASTAHMLKNAIAYKDERAAFLVQWLGTLINRHVRRFFVSINKSSPLRTGLVLKELHGSFKGITRYPIRGIERGVDRRQKSEKIFRVFQAQTKAVDEKHPKLVQKGDGVYFIDVNDPLSPLPGADKFPYIDLVISFEGKALGKQRIKNGYTSVSKERLAEQLASTLCYTLLQRVTKEYRDSSPLTIKKDLIESFASPHIRP